MPFCGAFDGVSTVENKRNEDEVCYSPAKRVIKPG
jgi:hypothetical protein